MTDDHHSRAREAEAEMHEAIEKAEPVPDDMERRSEELHEEIEATERDWESKRKEPGVPGAQPDLDEVETERQDLGGAPGGDDR